MGAYLCNNRNFYLKLMLGSEARWSLTTHLPMQYRKGERRLGVVDLRTVRAGCGKQIVWFSARGHAGGSGM
jgi:hypothetical protein